MRAGDEMEAESCRGGEMVAESFTGGNWRRRVGGGELSRVRDKSVSKCCKLLTSRTVLIGLKICKFKQKTSMKYVSNYIVHE